MSPLSCLLFATLVATSSEEKIDTDVLNAPGANEKVAVLLLLQDQLLIGPSALNDFIRTNKGADRLRLRSRVVGDLKRRADSEQSRVINDLALPSESQRFWILNGIACELSLDQVKKAAGHPLVKYIYAVRGLPPAESQTVKLELAKTSQTSGNPTIPWNVEQIGASKAWKEFGIRGKGVTVAMMDTQIDYLHPDLANRVWNNAGEVPNNGKDDDQNGYVDDVYGYNFDQNTNDVYYKDKAYHGTFTTGIVCGDGSSGIATGLAPEARFMCLSAFSFVGQALALQYSLEKGADVVNMSFSIPNLRNLRGAWRIMADNSVAAGLVLSSGAGNFRQNQEKPVQQRVPEDIPSVISAGGVDREQTLRPFSSEGPVEWGTIKFYGDFPMPEGLVKPDVVGFAGPNYPLVLAQLKYLDPNENVQGNSFSGPHASGVAALVVSANPSLPAWEVKRILEQTARDIEPKGKDNMTGWGLLDAYEAVREARKQ